MKTLKIMSMSLAIAFALPGVHAKEKWDFNEEKWKDVPIHEGKMISDDSLAQWGPWEEFAAPAAGPSAGGGAPAGNNFAQTNGGEFYRPTAQTTSSPSSSTGGTTPNPATLFTCTGSVCGFAVYTNSTKNAQGRVTTTAIAPSTINITGNASIVSWSLTQLDGTDPAPTYNNLGALPGSRSGLTITVNNVVTTPNARGSVTTTDTVSSAAPNGRAAVSVGTLMHDVATYVSRNNTTTYSTMTGSYVVGTPTSINELSALQAGKVTASYTGSAGGGAPVNITVDFGAATWSGSWNNGSNGTTTQSNVGGVTYRTGVVGFSASGTISGQTFTSTSLSATDAKSVTGSVQGAFFGTNATSLGGVADITKTQNNNASYQYVDTFNATRN